MIKKIGRISGSLAAEGWALYRQAFRELDTLAVQRHLMSQGEFHDVLDDSRVDKYVYVHDGTVAGLSTYTNDLHAVPLISPAYFQHRWPQHFRDGLIWYVLFVAVAPAAPRTAFAELLAAMHQDSSRDAITALDVCAHNEQDRHHLPRSVQKMLHRIDPGVEMERLDTQSYWAYRW
jgi:hypothetical protein